MKINKCAFVWCLLILCQYITAQTPVNDPSWIIRNGTNDATDNFNGSSVDGNKWISTYWGGGNRNNGAEIVKVSQLTFPNPGSSGYLQIEADTMIPAETYTNTIEGVPTPVTYYYKGGVIISNTPYKYGYFEISAKYPTSHYSYWPAFWLLGGACDASTAWAGRYGEIDICENGAETSYNSQMMGTNWHREDSIGPGACQVNSLTADPYVVENLNPLSNEHKFGMLWEVDRMSWYFDDILVHSVYDPVNTPKDPGNIIINFAVDPWYAPHHYNVWPADFKINYVNVWQLSTADCNTTQTITTFTPGPTYQTIKKWIVTDNSYTPTFNTSSNTTLRATDYILFDVGTTISDNGSGTFSAIVTPCPN
jgi:beta-glucanase (GH16 family)